MIVHQLKAGLAHSPFELTEHVSSLNIETYMLVQPICFPYEDKKYPRISWVT